ncbi:MAG: uncharacterized protein QOD78_1684, partial [Chloroflexota bacterium]|nr:uncharacterized protein [Chloroflexota bacterium]
MNRRAIARLAIVFLWLAMLGAPGVAGVAAADASAPPAGPPFPDPIDGQAVYDYGGLFTPETVTQAEAIIDAIESQTKAEMVVYTQAVGTSEVDEATADDHAAALMDQWGVGRRGINDGLVILIDLDTSLEHGQARLYGGSGFLDRYIDLGGLQSIADGTLLPLLADGQFDEALLSTLSQLVEATIGAPEPPKPIEGPLLAPGPPFPDPETDRAVYDFAKILSPDAIAGAETTIDAIEQRTAAEIVVYTQLVDYGVTTEETEARARALIDQWGVGRRGFDDGMAIFFDIDPSLQHGQVQLYAAPGFEAAFLSNNDRQAIFENDMVPFLQQADFNGALGIALDRIDAAATPEHAAQLQAGRQVNAVLGLVGAPVVFLLLAGWAFTSWRRFGKDPVYLDDPSILMPAPPPDLTAASGAFVMEGRATRRALTTAMLDLASRGLIAFREDRGLLGLGHKVGVDVGPPKLDAAEEARRSLNARRPIGPAEEWAMRELRELGSKSGEGFIEADKLPEFGTSVPLFDSKLESHVVDKGWMVDKPSKVIARWTVKGVLAIVAGAVALIAGFNVPISGLVLIGVAAIAGGVVIVLFAQGMPSVTMPGAMIRAMLAAYRRTLQKTMDQARSMEQVVKESGLDWLETPDQAVVWGTALGLQGEIEQVLARSLEDVRAQPSMASMVYFPAWYQTSNGTSFAAGAAAGSGGSIFSGSPVPDVGGMMSALGTIGNSPSSSGGGGGGGGGFG